MPCKKCLLNFKKRHFQKTQKNWLFSNNCLSLLVQCISLKLYTFIQWCFFVLPNKSTRIQLERYWRYPRDTVIQRTESGKIRKVASFPCRGRKILRVYFWYSLPDLKHDVKHFISIPLLNFPEKRALVPLLVNFIKWLPWKR